MYNPKTIYTFTGIIKFQSLIGNVQQDIVKVYSGADYLFQSLIGNVQPKSVRKLTVLLKRFQSLIGNVQRRECLICVKEQKGFNLL